MGADTRGDARSEVLAALRSASPPAAPPIVCATRAPRAASASVELLRASVVASGGALVRVESLDGIDAAIPGLAEATHVWSGIDGWRSRGAALEAAREADLAGLDFALLPGSLAVAENGAVWSQPGSTLERAAALLADALVLVVPCAAIVATLHDAYAAIDPASAAFGWFVSGPSKTADIEQALVLGAHGPRTATVVLLGSVDD